jgi:hypothetical protein
MQPSDILLRSERRIADAVLRKLFSPELAKAMVDGMFTEQTTTPLFLNDP